MKKTKQLLSFGLSAALALSGAAAFTGCASRATANVEAFVDDYDSSKEYNIDFLGWGDEYPREIRRKFCRRVFNEADG